MAGRVLEGAGGGTGGLTGARLGDGGTAAAVVAIKARHSRPVGEIGRAVPILLRCPHRSGPTVHILLQALQRSGKSHTPHTPSGLTSHILIQALCAPPLSHTTSVSLHPTFLCTHREEQSTLSVQRTNREGSRTPSVHRTNREGSLSVQGKPL